MFTSSGKLVTGANDIKGKWIVYAPEDKLQFDLPCNISDGSFATFGENLLVSGCGQVVLFDYTTGARRWSVNVSEGQLSVLNEFVYVTGLDFVSKVNANTGNLVHKWAPVEKDFLFWEKSALFADGSFLAVSHAPFNLQKHVVAVTRFSETGVVWHKSFASFFILDSLISEDQKTVFVPLSNGGNGTILALNANDGTELWRKNCSQYQGSLLTNTNFFFLCNTGDSSSIYKTDMMGNQLNLTTFQTTPIFTADYSGNNFLCSTEGQFPYCNAICCSGKLF